MFDFDRVIECRGTHASKWDNIARLSGIESPDAILMWVADMDFAAPPGVTSALGSYNKFGMIATEAAGGAFQDLRRG
jgi:bifunctional pyridoxal-dependent enzyme with beta-cystathionase and maltose regulon repressor activities